MCRPVFIIFLIIIFLIMTIPFIFSANSSFNKAMELFNQGNYEEARQVFETLAEKDKKNSQISYYLGRLELIDNHYEEARKYFERAIELNPDQSDYHLWLAKALMRKIIYSGFFGKVTNSMKIKRELDRAIERDSKNISALMIRYEMFIHSYEKGPITKKMVINEANSINKIDALMGHVAFAKFHHLTHNNEKAEKEYKKAFALDPNNRKVIGSYANFLRDTGRYDESIELLTNFLQDHPDDLKMNFILGVTLILSEKNYDKAKDYFSKSLHLRSEDGMPAKAIIHWNLGAAYSLLNHEGKAQKEWEKATAINPKLHKILDLDPELKRINAMLGRE